MIVNQFRVWARTAAPASRADGASALARAYLYSNLDDEQRGEAVETLTSMLDDPSSLVRRAIAEAFASSIDAPHHIVLALAEDQPSIAAIVLARSPILSPAELIDCAATAEAVAQAAIAGRPDLTSPVAAALAEIARPEALVVLARNPAVKLPAFSLRRMVERHGDFAELREALLRRSDLPTCVRIDLVAATARALAAFVAGSNWMSEERIARVAREAKDRAAIAIADTPSGTSGPLELVAHLRQAGQLTVGFILRAILSGKTELFRAALSDLADVPLPRVDGLTNHYESTGFAALYRKAALPVELLPAFRIALRAAHDVDWSFARGDTLSRSVVERVLTACEAVNAGELDKLIVLLRRFEAEAARDEARHASPQAGALALTPRPSRLAPLMLTDIDDMDVSPPETVAARIEPSLLSLDAETRAADLCPA